MNKLEKNDVGLEAELRALREKAPEELRASIMDRLPERRATTIVWPLVWGVVAAAAAVMVLFAVVRTGSATAPAVAEVGVRFEYHAPAAERVELVGSFTQWQAGEIVLEDPEGTGHWHVEIPLPDGEYEYQFFVDGQDWVPDPRAKFHRPDGFGSRNALVYVLNQGGAT